MEIALEIAKPQACQCPEKLVDEQSLFLKTSSGFLQCQQIGVSCQQCVLSRLTEDHHKNKLMEKGTKQT